MSDVSFVRRQQRQQQRATTSLATSFCCLKIGLLLFFCAWCFVLYYHISPRHATQVLGDTVVEEVGTQQESMHHLRAQPSGNAGWSVPFEETEESYHIVFSTGCSEFQDWQSIGVYSSADAVGQRGIITRIASGCSEAQEVSLRHAMSHLPKRCRIHFAPNTDVKDHNGHFYKYANKPLGMMHWLMHAEPEIPPQATVALIDPDFYFLKPLWHDSFETEDKYFATGRAKKTPMPRDAANGNKVRVSKGSMIAQRYGIGGKPWTLAPGRNNQKAWGLKEFFTSIGRPDSPALAADLLGDESRAGDFYSIGAPYIALASDWLPIATNWTALMYMAVERNFGNLAEMYAMVVATADYGIRPVMIDSLMVSNVDAGDEGWPWVDLLPLDRGCDPALLKENIPLPTFLHYCQTYRHPEIEPKPGHLFSKYQVPDDILNCPAGSETTEDAKGKRKAGRTGGMILDANGFLPEPNVHSHAKNINQLRNIFAHCFATRGTNQAVRDYRSWFCAEHK